MISYIHFAIGAITAFCFSIALLFSFLIMSDPRGQSDIVYLENGTLNYVSDNEFNRIPDYSYAGCQNNIPERYVSEIIYPVDGDNTGLIQDRINLSDAEVLILCGEFDVYGTIYLNKSMTLKGCDKDTVIRAIGPEQRTVIIAGNNLEKSQSTFISTIIDDFLPVNSLVLTLYQTNIPGLSAQPILKTREGLSAQPILAIGDIILIVHPSTSAWLEAVDYGGTSSESRWDINSVNIVYRRKVVKIENNQITLDMPIYNHFNRSLSIVEVYKINNHYLSDIGIEDLAIQIDCSQGIEDHAWNGIGLINIENSWVKGVTVSGFGKSGIYTRNATRITVDQCQAIDPCSHIIGSRRYNFDAESGSHGILFERCYAKDGRHSFAVSGASSASDIVFLDGRSELDYTSSESHKKWATGLLYDNMKFFNGRTNPNQNTTFRRLALYNRGDFGNGHGWTTAHSTLWNCHIDSTGSMLVQKPPTGQNYAIGNNKPIRNDGPFEGELGYIEQVSGIKPKSLYRKQLASRRGK